jgi:hypothetical protein
MVRAMAAVTLLVGAGYTCFGAFLIFAGAGWLVQPDNEPWLPALFLGRSITIVIGIAFLPLGILGLLAGLGSFLCKQWGHILTFILASLTILLGLIWISGVENVLQDTTDVALGAAQLLYGILAFFILMFGWPGVQRTMTEATGGQR